MIDMQSAYLSPDEITKLQRKLAERGQLIEAGWLGFRVAAVPPDASKEQLIAMRMAFFGGAQHLFQSLLAIMDPGHEPTDADMGKMDRINEELTEFIKIFELEHLKTRGNA